jgi:hypothetical protein
MFLRIIHSVGWKWNLQTSEEKMEHTDFPLHQPDEAHFGRIDRCYDRRITSRSKIHLLKLDLALF